MEEFDERYSGKRAEDHKHLPGEILLVVALAVANVLIWLQWLL